MSRHTLLGVAQELRWIDNEIAEALGLHSRAPGVVVETVASLANVRLPLEPRPVTGEVILNMVREVQEAMWERRVAIAQAEGIAQRCCPKDYGQLVGLALDLGLGQTVLRGGTLVEMAQALRSPVRKRLEGVAATLLRCAAEGYGAVLVDRIRGRG